jgi:S-(hydroxymethyl)glutathione dehydrogenase/alcohol dehydrogenase
VAVIAAGGVGLNTIQCARLVGAHPIIAIDPVDLKLEKALEFGATHVINPKKEDQVARVKEITKGRGVDYCFVTCAGIEIKRDGFMMLSRKGLEVVIGHGHKEMMSAWDAQELIAGKTLGGSAMGRTKTRVDMPNIMELYKAGRLKLDELISNRFPLEKINEAMKEVEEGKVLRNVITF